MTSRWPIFFSLCLALAPAYAATVAGAVELTQTKSKSREGVVVWLEPLAGPPSLTAGRFTLDQKNKKFTPHVLAAPVGATVDFPNHDPIFHNAFSNFAGQPFDTGLYAPGTSHRITFRREGVVRVFCNIHANMSAVIVIVPSSYYAVSTADGAWRIPNVPPGEYRLRLFHERSTPETLARLETRVKVEDNPLVLPRLAVSEAGYLPVPHQNKHGRPYPAKSLESTQYLGGR
jgi:plastocyanin